MLLGKLLKLNRIVCYGLLFHPKDRCTTPHLRF